jgi:KUP system potassium uptake protein
MPVREGRVHEDHNPGGVGPAVEGEDTRTGSLEVLALGALGVVYGDIGTSPLYAFRECLHGPHGMAPSPENVLALLSLILWSLVVVVTVKYLVIVMRADNRGEGGILALMALIRAPAVAVAARRPMLVILGLFGAALLYGDGMITPAISVLSAVEGLGVATRVFEPYIIPITVVILAGLFLVQRRGTARIGALFGPLMLLWMVVMATLGVTAIARVPKVLGALNPLLALRLFENQGARAFGVLGAVFLVVTGGEALYADMGHFGKRPIRVAWFAAVLPSLLLNYFGQGALLLASPDAVVNPFFRLAPPWALYPLVALATAATVVASQAVISGAFSLTRQAVQLGYSPRVQVRHTSEEEIGQIYVPLVNWALLAAAVALVLAFRTSSAMAAAYGVAVSLTMVITTLLAFVVMRSIWQWSLLRATLVAGGLLAVDLAFLGSNLLKIREGGWFPLAVGVCGYLVMSTWRRGRELLGARLEEVSPSLEELRETIAATSPARVSGTAVFMTGNPSGTPPTALLNLKYNRVLHERVVFLTIITEETPRVPRSGRVEVTWLGEPFWRVVLRYGFMQEANVPAALRLCERKGLRIDPEEVVYFLGRETLLATKRPGMPIWRERLFALITRNAVGPASAFGLPVGQIVELGAQIEL